MDRYDWKAKHYLIQDRVSGGFYGVGRRFKTSRPYELAGVVNSGQVTHHDFFPKSVLSPGIMTWSNKLGGMMPATMTVRDVEMAEVSRMGFSKTLKEKLEIVGRPNPSKLVLADSFLAAARNQSNVLMFTYDGLGRKMERAGLRGLSKGFPVSAYSNKKTHVFDYRSLSDFVERNSEYFRSYRKVVDVTQNVKEARAIEDASLKYDDARCAIEDARGVAETAFAELSLKVASIKLGGRDEQIRCYMHMLQGLMDAETHGIYDPFEGEKRAMNRSDKMLRDNLNDYLVAILTPV